MEENKSKPFLSKIPNLPENPHKFLAYILRHKAKEFHIPITKEGYVKIEDLLILSTQTSFDFNEEILREMVLMDNKLRYEIKEDHPAMIRAIQGHSIASVEDDHLLEKITNPFLYPLIIHGTFLKPWSSINKTGLNRMYRNSIHFAIGYPHDSYVISGMMPNTEVFIELNGAMCYYNNIPLYKSYNNVILSPGDNDIIPSKYFKRVMDCHGSVLLSQRYDYFLLYNIKGSQLELFSRFQRENIGNDIKMGIDSCIEINAFTSDFVTKDVVKSPFVMVIERGDEEVYCMKMKEMIERGKIEHPGVFIDYIAVNSLYDVNLLMLESKMMKKIKVNYGEYYTNVGIKEVVSKEEYEVLMKIRVDWSKEKVIETIRCSFVDIRSEPFDKEKNEEEDLLMYYYDINESYKDNLQCFLMQLSLKGWMEFKGILCMSIYDHHLLCKQMMDLHIPLPAIFTNRFVIMMNKS